MRSPHSSNLAYNFDMFDTEEMKLEQKVKPKSKIHIVKDVAARNGNFVKIILATAFILTIPGYYIMSKAQISELSTKINDEMVRLEESKSENQRLRSDLDNLYTLTRVEEYALSELGLEKIKTSQETHVILNTESLTEVIEEDYANPLMAMGDWFNGILEYLGFR